MRRVLRLPAPAQLLRWAPRWRQELLDALDAYASGASSPPPDELWNKYRKPYVQDQLQRMFLGKCAYCESHIGTVSFARIDHYRPKRGGYPELTFEWDNLILSCELCNHHKSDQFPLQNGDPTLPMLLNPCDDDLEAHLAFDGARLAPRSKRGATTIGLLQLNRDDLFDRRRALLEIVEFVKASITAHEQHGKHVLADQARALLRDLLAVEAEYTAMLVAAFQ